MRPVSVSCQQRYYQHMITFQTVYILRAVTLLYGIKTHSLRGITENLITKTRMISTFQCAGPRKEI